MWCLGIQVEDEFLPDTIYDEWGNKLSSFHDLEDTYELKIINLHEKQNLKQMSEVFIKKDVQVLSEPNISDIKIATFKKDDIVSVVYFLTLDQIIFLNVFGEEFITTENLPLVMSLEDEILSLPLQDREEKLLELLM